jgi:hypothetical protein
MLLIWGLRKAIYFSPNDWTTQISLNRFDKFASVRMRFFVPHSQSSQSSAGQTQRILPVGQIDPSVVIAPRAAVTTH